MAEKKRRYTLLGNAEAYQSEVTKRRTGGPRPYRQWSETQAVLTPQLIALVRDVSRIPSEHRLDEVVVELRLDPSFIAKSYHPRQLLTSAGLELRGSDSWQPDKSDQPGRRLYVSAAPHRLSGIADIVRQSNPSDGVRKDLAKIQEIRLPPSIERAPLSGSEPKAKHAVEVVLFDWDSRRRREAVQRVRQVLTDSGAETDSVIVKSYDRGPTFIAATVTTKALKALSSLNYVRLASLLPRVELTRVALGSGVPAPNPVPKAPLSQDWIAVFDGGYAPGAGHLDPFVHAEDCTTAAPIQQLVDHGTAVVSAALYGNIDSTSPLPPPPAKVASFRVLPDPSGDHLELYGVIDSIEDVVPRLIPQVRVINLSFGPAGPISNAISRFTFALDRMAYTHGKLFVTAVGNWGDKPNVANRRIQVPSDAVNTLSVGSFGRNPRTAARVTAPYSCIGPGRPGALTKPDIVAFGGTPQSPFFVSDGVGNIVGSYGTSFAAPLVSRSAAEILARCTSLSPVAARALIVHSSQRSKDVASHGHGFIDSTYDEMVACTPTRVSIIYDGILSPKKTYRLPFLLPTKFKQTSRCHFAWTIVYVPDVDGNCHDEYTVCGLEVHFRPNANMYDWSPPKGKPGRSMPLHSIEDAKKIAGLKAAGWTRSILPTSSTQSQSEAQRRTRGSKWETTVCGQKNRDKSVYDSALTVSVVPRGPWESVDAVSARYSAVLTMYIPKYTGDLYAEVEAEFPQLQSVPVAVDSVQAPAT